jgi:tetratricopeptide (TPR) repeat protein
MKKYYMFVCIVLLLSCTNKNKNQEETDKASYSFDGEVQLESEINTDSIGNDKISLPKVIYYTSTTSNSDKLLMEYYGYDHFGLISDKDKKLLYDRSKEIFFEFLRLYQNNEIQEALLTIEAGIELYPLGVYYYHYGNCFMDLHNYENTEKAFLKALQFLYFEIPFEEPYYYGKNPLYTFDHNNAPREKYFTYYNLACIYSHEEKFDLALEYLKEALEYGYPYIDHIYNDPDIYGLLDSSENIKDLIREIYNDGFVNTLSYKKYYYGRRSEFDEYSFTSDIDIITQTSYSGTYFRYGTYEVKNYQIIIKYYKVKGTEGRNEIFGGGVWGAYEYYEPFEDEIQMDEILSMKEMAKVWERKW